MSKKILFLGPLYPIEHEFEIKNNSVFNSSNAPNMYQWNLLNGLHEIVQDELRVINVLPVGVWKIAYKKLFLPDMQWASNGVNGYEIGCINLPFLKQLHRSQKTRKLLEKLADEETEIIIYSPYMPFLKAVYHLPKKIKVTVIITDLPEFYDLGKTSCIRKILRKQHTRLVYRYLDRVDRFVVITKQMCDALHVKDRPWICIEGICNRVQDECLPVRGQKKVILYSGTLHYQYGIKNLLEAFQQIKLKSVELWICGSGEAETEIKALAAEDNRVKFYGFCTQLEVAALRAQAAVLVNPRQNDGEYVKYSFPSKTMEYMASGKPVVMYKLDGIPDEYDAYLNYVPPSDRPSYQLAETLRTIILNYEAAMIKAKKARTFVLENKNNIVQAKKLMTFIEQNRC